MGKPHDTLKRRSAWSIGLRWLVVLVILTLFAGAMIPLVMKPRKRSRATSILEEMRLIDGAKDQYAIENNLTSDAKDRWQQVKLYLKVGTRLYNQSTELDMPRALSLDQSVEGVVTSKDVPEVFWSSSAN